MRFDVGLHGTMLNSLQSGVSDQSVGVDLGFTVARNVWISIGYNFTGFRDDDFEASRYTAQGPFIKFRMKADQDTFKDLALDSASSKPALSYRHDCRADSLAPKLHSVVDSTCRSPLIVSSV